MEKHPNYFHIFRLFVNGSGSEIDEISNKTQILLSFLRAMNEWTNERAFRMVDWCVVGRRHWLKLFRNDHLQFAANSSHFDCYWSVSNVVIEIDGLLFLTDLASGRHITVISNLTSNGLAKIHQYVSIRHWRCGLSQLFWLQCDKPTHCFLFRLTPQRHTTTLPFFLSVFHFSLHGLLRFDTFCCCAPKTVCAFLCYISFHFVSIDFDYCRTLPLNEDFSTRLLNSMETTANMFPLFSLVMMLIHV